MSIGRHESSGPRDPTRPWAPSPFGRLARVHAIFVAGDGMFTIAMAGTVFSLNQGAARGEVAKLLIFTIAPFAVAAPLVGPLIDRARGGRKWMIFGLAASRAVLAALLIQHLDAWAFYPLGLLMLALSRAYIMARGAMVPTVVHNDSELVRANSHLSKIGGLFAVIGVVIAFPFAKFGGPAWVLGVLAIFSAAAAVLAAQLPPTRVADEPADEVEKVELRSAGIRQASMAMLVVRATVGFLTFLVVFHFKENDQLFFLGLVAAAAQTGYLCGAFIAPRVRQTISEERMLFASLAVTVVAGLLTAAMGAEAGAALISFGVGVTSNAAKQAFDSLVQRDAPDANRGRAFARFETRFQLIWVVGALVPIVITVPIQIGFMAVAAASAGALAWYYAGSRRIEADARRRPSPLAGEPVLVEPRIPSRSFLRRRGFLGAEAPGRTDVDETLIARGPSPTSPVFPATPDNRDDKSEYPGLFGDHDESIPDSLVDAPDVGLFAVSETPPLIFDGEAALADDYVDEHPVVAPPTGQHRGDPGPPSLVRDDDSSDALALTSADGTFTEPAWRDTESDSDD